MAERLIQGGVAFVDRAGNCHLDLGGAHVAHVGGRRPRAEPASAGFRAPAYRALFVLLANPELASAPMRHIADLARVSLGTVAGVMKRLRGERFVVGSRSRPQLVGAAALVDRWVAAYADVLRPKLLIGRYDPGTRDPEAMTAQIERVLAERWPWAYGGTAASHRLTGYYRGDETVVHVSGDAEEHVVRQLEVPPSRDGSLMLVQPPAPIALEGPLPHVAHPLLVYAELLCATSPRAAEAAREVRERFLKIP
jgi:hypothetical protein